MRVTLLRSGRGFYFSPSFPLRVRHSSTLFRHRRIFFSPFFCGFPTCLSLWSRSTAYFYFFLSFFSFLKRIVEQARICSFFSTTNMSIYNWFTMKVLASCHGKKSQSFRSGLSYIFFSREFLLNSLFSNLY